MLLALCLLLCGCNIDGKKDYTKTEDLDEATLQGMAKDITKEMTLKQKIGQLFMVSMYSGQFGQQESDKGYSFHEKGYEEISCGRDSSVFKKCRF